MSEESTNALNCPLCGAEKINSFSKDESRDYYQCQKCKLVFVPANQHLSASEEKKRYDFHENSPEDPGYREFLNRIFTPLNDQLAQNSHGLDFGCGPGPTLSVMLEEAGHSVDLYDCFYARKAALLEKQYDFITASEVVEHLHKPGLELDRLWSCLKPNGILAIMTKRVVDSPSFAKWHYKNDDTHVCFFSSETFEWLSERWNADIAFPHNDVVIFQKI